MAAPRAIRVFVSSTFRDMQAEREELVKRVFPELRRRCAQRGVAWSEVDLRWGVTDEEAAEGAVLPICLREIELSRPYFIGLLGDRYGWVPDAIPADLAAQHGWLRDDAGRSVTEMEILHGVLNDPAMEGLAFFYLRDPAWVATVPDDERPVYVDGDPEAQSRLADLKVRVRDSGHPARDYADPVALGALVAADLGAVLERLFPAAPEPDPRAREAEAHEAFAAIRFDGYVERPALAAALDALGPVGVVEGEAGAGKSALVAAWAAALRAAGHRVITHFVGATADSSRWPALVRRLLAELAHVDGRPVPDDVDDGALPPALVSSLAISGAAAPTTVVLDGLDQLAADDAHLPLFWLPEVAPPGVRIVVTAGAGPARDELARRGWPALTIEPLGEPERRAVITSFLGKWSKALDDAPLARLAASPATGNPLYLRTVLDELRQWGDHMTLGEQIDRYLAAPDLAALYGVVLGRYEADFERGRPGLVRDAMSFVWASRRGIAEADLLDALGGPPGADPLPRAVWSPLFLAAETHLVASGTRLSFAHDAMRAAVASRYQPGPATHDALAGHLLAAGTLDERVLDELPHQLTGAGRWDDLAGWLAGRDAFDAFYRHDLTDLRATWTAVERGSAHRAVDAYRPLLDDGALGFQVAVLLAMRGFLPEAITAMDAAARAHRAANEHAKLVACLLDRGAWQIQTGAIDGAAAAYDEAATFATDGERRVDVLGGQAAVARARGDGPAALALLDQQEQLARSLGLIGDVERSLGTQAAVLYERGDLAGALAKATLAEAAAREVGDPQLLSAALLVKAQALAGQGHMADAVAVDEQLATDARRLGDRYGLSVALVNGAANRLSLGDLDQAAALAAEARDTARAIGSTEPESKALHVLAVVAHRRGEPDRALALLDDEAALAELAGDQNGAALALGERGTILREQGDLAGALAAHADEQRRYEAIGSASGVATSIGNQAAVKLQAGDVAGGTALLADQEARCRAMGWAEGLATALGNQATVLLHTGDPAGAEAKLNEQRAVCEAVGDITGTAAALQNLALLAHGRGDLTGALALTDQQLPLAQQAGDGMAVIMGTANRGELLCGLGRIDEGLASLRQAEGWARQNGLGPMADQIAQLVKRYG